MFEKVAEFAAASRLEEDEIAALQAILADGKLAAAGRELAARCMVPDPGKLPEAPEGGDFSRIRYAAAFFAAPKIPEFFAEYGFPERVMLETMTDLVVWLRNEKKHRGICGLNVRAWEWQVELYRARVTRHGRLECNSEWIYNRETLKDAAGNVLLRPGDAVINLHIPEDGPMRMEDCFASMRRMVDFFAKYRPQVDWKGFLCESWLLDRQLRAMLPGHSNIVKFQDLGPHYPVHETRDSVFRIFGTPEADPEAVPNPTSLQRNAAKFIREGGRFMEEGMFIPKSVLS
ncbi:MAG: acyltransferase domain-containing protein [Lentisphaeria bacterium]|nr:acyltransferase domain-containing protein [Lentisphaeria bacterium]